MLAVAWGTNYGSRKALHQKKSVRTDASLRHFEWLKYIHLRTKPLAKCQRGARTVRIRVRRTHICDGPVRGRRIIRDPSSSELCRPCGSTRPQHFRTKLRNNRKWPNTFVLLQPQENFGCLTEQVSTLREASGLIETGSGCNRCQFR